MPRGGVAVHINAFNFPIWGLLEKFAPSFLAGMPCIGKPATATSYLTEAMVRIVNESGILPAGALQLVIGSTGDLLDRLDGRDVVTFTGSADTAAKLRVHPNVVRHSIPFNAEADSLNCAILAPDVTPDDEEFDLFVKEVVREMTVKAGQKCTAIRRAIVPRQHLDAVAERIAARLAKVVVGDPSVEGVTMGALASHAQQADVAERVALLRQGAEVVYGGGDGFAPVGEGTANGAFFPPTLLLARKPLANSAVHDVEAFGPVSTLMPYDGIDEALQLAARGQGSLVCSLVTQEPGDRGDAWCRRWPRCTAACTCSTASPRPSPPATARRCRCSSTAARAARAAARNWAACAPSRTAAARGGAGLAHHADRRDARIRARRAGAGDRRAPVPPPLRGTADRRIAADRPPA